MASITVTVGGTPPGSGTYTETASKGNISINASGDITVSKKGKSTLTFNRAAGSTWSFTGSTISPAGGNVTQKSVTDRQIVLEDNDTSNSNFTYSLNTDSGNFDPQILNRGN